MKELEMIFHGDVSFRAQSIYRYLRYRQGKNGYCYQSHKTIARDNKCSVSTVKGYIEKINQQRPNGSKTPNRYTCKSQRPRPRV